MQDLLFRNGILSIALVRLFQKVCSAVFNEPSAAASSELADPAPESHEGSVGWYIAPCYPSQHSGARARVLATCGARRPDRECVDEHAAGQLWYMNKEGCEFDEGRYLADLRKTMARLIAWRMSCCERPSCSNSWATVTTPSGSSAANCRSRRCSLSLP